MRKAETANWRDRGRKERQGNIGKKKGSSRYSEVKYTEVLKIYAYIS